MIDSFGLVAYASLAASRTLLQQLPGCLTFTLDSVGTNKKVISINYGSSTNYRKPWRWVRFDLMLTMRDIYINSNQNPLLKFTSSRTTESIFPWNISRMITNTIPINTRIVIIYAIKQGILFWVGLANGMKAIVEQILMSKKERKTKEQDCESHS